MKNKPCYKLFRIAILFAFFISVFSILNCKRESSVINKYSCNAEVNQWVINNFESIKNFTRDDFIKIDDSKQRAAFRSLTPEKQLQLWREKLTKEIVVCSTDEERNHVLKLLGMTDIKLYTDTVYANNFVRQANKWYDEAVQLFGWSRFKITLMVATFYLSDESDKTDSFLKLKGALVINPPPDCACHRTIFCSPGFSCDKSADCTPSNHGCGWLGVESCDGICNMN